jgi:hypothetical protein
MGDGVGLKGRGAPDSYRDYRNLTSTKSHLLIVSKKPDPVI